MIKCKSCIYIIDVTQKMKEFIIVIFTDTLWVFFESGIKIIIRPSLIITILFFTSEKNRYEHLDKTAYAKQYEIGTRK